MTCSALTWRTVHGVGKISPSKPVIIINAHVDCKYMISHLLIMYFAELSPLELHLLPDIIIQLWSMAAACLFLVTIFMLKAFIMKWHQSCNFQTHVVVNVFQGATLETSTQTQTWKTKMTFLSTSLPQGSGLNGKWRGGIVFCEYVYNLFLG